MQKRARPDQLMQMLEVLVFHLSIEIYLSFSGCFSFLQKRQQPETTSEETESPTLQEPDSSLQETIPLKCENSSSESVFFYSTL